MLRSAWLKWARGVEHQKVLARALREFRAVDSYEYVRTDNATAQNDPLVRMHWRLAVKEPYPERWSVLIGDAMANLRAALDHALWAAVVSHSGHPQRPTRVMFPICSDLSEFKRREQELSPLVAPDVWEVVSAFQPYHGGGEAYMAPLEVLRWLSNMDKHRVIRVVGRTQENLGLPIIVRSPRPVVIVEEWTLDGPATNGTVIARLKFVRDIDPGAVDVIPTFLHIESIQICDQPAGEYRTLGSAMDITRDKVLEVLMHMSERLGFQPPDDLYLGQEHDEFAKAPASNIGAPDETRD